MASSTLVALLLFRLPILAILLSLMPRSARYRGTRVPSTIVPPLISVSNSAMTPSFLYTGCEHSHPRDLAQRPRNSSPAPAGRSSPLMKVPLHDLFPLESRALLSEA